jgi:hypothetical protein
MALLLLLLQDPENLAQGVPTAFTMSSCSNARAATPASRSAASAAPPLHPAVLRGMMGGKAGAGGVQAYEDSSRSPSPPGTAVPRRFAWRPRDERRAEAGPPEGRAVARRNATAAIAPRLRER